jgi:hypothetical protein
MTTAVIDSEHVESGVDAEGDAIATMLAHCELS